MLIVLKNMKRVPGRRLALHPFSAYDQYDTGMPKHGTEPADRFDCINKPIYGCPEGVVIAGGRCSKCIVRTFRKCVDNAPSICSS